MSRALDVFAAAADAPAEVALVAGGRMVDYAALAGRVRAACAHLTHAGLDDGGDRRLLAIAPARTVESIAFLLAAVSRGIPLLLLHPRWTNQERARALEGTPLRGVLDDDVVLGDDGPPPTTRVVGDDAPLAVLFTSGSTGAPRAIPHTRATFLAAARASEANLGWRDDDRWMLVMPPAHAGGLNVLLRCLVARKTVVLDPPGAFEPKAVAAAMREARVSIVSLVPTMLRRLLDEPSFTPRPSLRAVLLGGAAASDDLLADAADRGVPVLATYGMTETCGQVTTQPLGTIQRGVLGAGAPLPGYEVRIVDERIHVRGPSVARTDLAGTRLTDDEGWLDTGDLGAIDARGCLHVRGRADDVIITGGENVHPAEIEPVLRRIDGVRDVCVVGVPDRDLGHRVVALVVSDDAARVEDAWPGALGAMAGHRRPRELILVPALPVNAMGKLDRREAARLAESHGPPRSRC